MSSVFGDGGASEANRKAVETQRQQTQRANEDAGRSKQKAERGAGRRAGRDLFLGNLSSLLNKTLGG